MLPRVHNQHRYWFCRLNVFTLPSDFVFYISQSSYFCTNSYNNIDNIFGLLLYFYKLFKDDLKQCASVMTVNEFWKSPYLKCI